MSKKEKLTVGEVAKLLDINPHTIRYYDREGLISSEIDNKNGYRLFDYEDINRLSNIILLRDSNISIKEIKHLIANYNTELYNQYLLISINNIDKEIVNLKNRKLRIQKNIDDINFKENDFKITKYNKRILKIISTKKYEEDYSLYEFYKDVRKKEITNLISENLYYNFCEDEIIYCIKSNLEFDIQLDKGSYLEYKCWIKDENIITSKINEFIEYATKNRINITENIYMEISPDAILVVDKGYYATIFANLSSNS